MFDIETYKSHPDKTLLQHTNGVLSKTKMLSNSEMAELAAIFHDLGKMNPNFQSKLLGKSCFGYSHHAFLSAFAFFCMACKTKFKDLNLVFAVCVMIAKHHGNLPNFVVKDDRGGLSKKEVENVKEFLKSNNIPFSEFAKQLANFPDFEDIIRNEKALLMFRDKFFFNVNKNEKPLSFFLEVQKSFASLILSDKVDAACFDSYFENDRSKLEDFGKNFNLLLSNYLSKLNQESELNKVRTKIREEAVRNIAEKLSNGQQIFELTSPTGSGKTLMLLSLAGEIIKRDGPKRIIYAIPFLSITEQVENEVLRIFECYEEYIQRIDSKSENPRFDDIQSLLDDNPNDDLFKEMNLVEFQEKTFEYPFVITTFVRFFETLLSNKNSELLKLPNFSNCIFLLDEIQALPPRLYSFFVGYLEKFCKMFNSYAVISTATQPNFGFEKDSIAEKFFPDYLKPEPLLPLSYFDENVFNRYSISFKKDGLSLEELALAVIEKDNSVLVILNTIDDTKKLYNLLLDYNPTQNLILLNTHFTPNDRKRKIASVKKKLHDGERIILISTQLIEAGVDIDFPVLFRDFTTVSSIVQSAGRCNRNGKLPCKGDVTLFFLKGENGKDRVDCIFRGKDRELIRFTKEAFKEKAYNENELMIVQKAFFDAIKSELIVADYGKTVGTNNLIDDIKECAFEKIGQFSLIDKIEYGEIRRFYVSEDDDRFEILLDLQDELKNLLKSDCSENIIKVKKKEIENHLKKMSNQIVEVRIRKDQTVPIMADNRDYFGLMKIDSEFYTSELGVNLDNQTFII